MKALQLWLPTLGANINLEEVGRDARRAFEQWQGELTVWLLPEITRPARWTAQGVRNLALPSESFERIDVIHVDEEGRFYAPSTGGRLPATVDGLLETWLNAHQTAEGLSLVYAVDSLSLMAPWMTPDGVFYGQRKIELEPGPFMPVVSVNETGERPDMRWPPDGSPPTVSPEAESLKRFPLKRIKRAGADPPQAVTPDGRRALRVFLKWPGPLEWLMPLLSGVDDLYSQAQIRELAQMQGAQADELRLKALRGADPHLFSGHTTLELSWFRPAIVHKGIRHLMFSAEDKGLGIPDWARTGQWEQISIERLLELDDWKRVLSSSVPIRRAWGASGLFWTLLLDRLDQGRALVSCEQCGRLITGKRGKRFCSAGEDMRCFKARRAADRRALRQS